MSDGGSCGGGPGSGEGASVDLRSYAYLALMVLIGSSTAVAARYAVQGLPVGVLPLARFGVAGLCLLPVVLRNGGGGLARLLRDDGWRLLLAAFLSIPLNQAFFLNGARLAPTSHVALIYAACPLVVLIVATALGQERLVPARLVGVLASVFGVAVIALESLWRGGTAGHATLRGDLLLVGAVVSWGMYLTASKPLIARHGPLTTLAGTFLAGALLQAPIALATYPTWPPLAEVPLSAWGGLAYLTLFVTVVGLAFQNMAMQRLDASQVATFSNAAPLLTIAQGAWLFGETLTPVLALGGLLTVGGIFWTSRPAPTPEPAEADFPLRGAAPVLPR